jgi:hypothetical protein
MTTTLKNRLIIIIKNKPAESKKIAVKFIIASKSEKIAVEYSSREPRLRRLTTTLTTPLNIHKTNVLTDSKC